MPEVETQIRAYFDEVVERVTDEDIRIRATTERGIPIRSPRFQIRPIAAVAIGFGIAMTVLGGVFIAEAWFVPETADVAGNGVGSSTGNAERHSPGLLLLLMAGFGLLAFGMWSVRRSAGDVRQRGDDDMQTIERPETLQAPSGELTKLRKRNRLLAWALVILAMAVMGLGAWLISDVVASDDLTTVPAEVDAALETYNAAWLETNRAAFLDATTEEYTFASDQGTYGQASQASQVGVLAYFEFELFERVIMGDGNPYYVASEQRVRFASAGTWYDGVSIVTLVETDGTWKVAQHTWVGEVP
ncbi:MAG: hypothetical protein KJP22_08100 [Acidimicrobiia bacterium]|nr:hypothetical protein [Acidimicrobiia bacterium]